MGRPTGRFNHRRTTTARSGKAPSKVASNSSTCRRAVEVRRTTSSRPAASAGHPRSRASRIARRSLRSRAMSVAWTSPIADFTSTTNAMRARRWKARMSMDPTLAVHAERHLCRALPPGDAQPAHEPIHDFRVRPVDEAVQLLASPGDSAHQPRREWREQALEGGNRQAIGATLFNSGNDAARHSCGLGEILLTPASSHPKCAQPSGEPHDIHIASMTRRPLLGLI
jgi:hypothetical protein